MPREYVTLNDVRILLREHVRRDSKLGVFMQAIVDRGQIIAFATTGTPPLVVSSTTLVENLNADMLDGHHASDFVLTTDVVDDIVLENVDDRVAELLVNANGVTWTYNDAANSITAQVDHGGLTGLNDDDHPQYARIDALRAFVESQTFNKNIVVGQVVQTAGFKLTTTPVAGYVLTSDAGGTGTWQPNLAGSHGALTGLSADDHTQYARTDGTRTITGNQAFSAGITVTGTAQADAVKITPGAGAGKVLVSDADGVGSWGNAVNDHGSLTGLTDDDHAQYVMNTGRSGGQTVRGGTGAGDSLFLLSTSNATRGTIRFGSFSSYNEVNDRWGIGTLVPEQALHVATTLKTSGFIMTTGAQNGYVLTSDAGGVASWAAAGGGVSDHGALTGLTDDDHTQYPLLTGRSTGQTLYGGITNSGILTLNSTTDSAKGRIDLGAGVLSVNELTSRVGIGTTNPHPQAKLHIKGALGGNNADIHLETQYFGPSESSIYGYNLGSNNGMRLAFIGYTSGLGDSSIAQGIRLYYDTDTFIAVHNYGLSVGTTTSRAAFAVSGNAAIGTDFVTSSLGVAAKISPPNGLIVQGKVGFGTDQVEEELEVFGTARVSGFIMQVAPASGYVLTTDATGVGTWQPAPAVGGITDHGALTGLADDDHSQYVHLTRGGTQTIQDTLQMSGVIIGNFDEEPVFKVDQDNGAISFYHTDLVYPIEAHYANGLTQFMLLKSTDGGCLKVESNSTGQGINATNSGTGTGVSGSSTSGTGVDGFSFGVKGVTGRTSSGIGIEGISITGTAVVATVTGGGKAMTTSGGDVGISTPTPSGRLHVVGASGSDALYIETETTGHNPNYRVVQNRVVTTNDTATTIQTFPLTDNTSYLIESRVLGRRTGGAGNPGDTAAYTLFAAAKRTGGGDAELISTGDLLVEPQASWTIFGREDNQNCEAGFDIDGSNLLVVVSGIASTTYAWHVTSILQSVSE